MFLSKTTIFFYIGNVQYRPVKRDVLVKITMTGRSHIVAIIIHALTFYRKLELIGSRSQLSKRANSYGR